jgi:hypothetical protein
MNRRAFIKRSAGGAAAIAGASLLNPKLQPAFAAGTANQKVTATADDMNPAGEFSLLQWTGPKDATVQVRQLQLLGSWTDWQTAPPWTDLNAEGNHTCRSGLLRTNSALALQARALTDGVSNLAIVPVSPRNNKGSAEREDSALRSPENES